MGGERRQLTFQQLLDEGVLEIGDGYRAQNDELGGDGPIFLRAGHVTDTQIEFSGVERFHERLAHKVASKLSKAGDTVVTTKGNSTGRTAFVIERMPQFVYSPHLSYWRSRNPSRVCGGFLRYWSRGREFVEQLSGMKASTDMAPYLSLTDQRRLSITLPAIGEQEAIAAILGALDDKIELNRRMNATLEAMARALFENWFVFFDPVRAKLNGRPPASLDPATASLFPDSFQGSSLGDIPAGWVVTTLKAVTSKIGSGATPRGGSAVYVESGVALIRSQNVYDHEFKWEGLARLSDRSAAELNNVEVRPGDVLLNITGDSILRTCVVDPSVLPARVNQHVAIIRAAPPMPARFLHLYMVQSRVKDFLLGLNAGATRPAVTKGHLEGVSVLLPPAQLLADFDRATAPLFLQIETNRVQSRALAALRDTLLPELLSGGLKIRTDMPDPRVSVLPRNI